MTDGRVTVRPMTMETVDDRLALCWGHVDDWEDREVVAESRAWLENVNRAFSPSTFLAYRDGEPVGMIEFLPAALLDRFGLVPCRSVPEQACWSSDPIPDAPAADALFVSCLWVDPAAQNDGVGTTLLEHLLESDVVGAHEGIYTVVTDQDTEFVDPDDGIWWPAGPRSFYESFGFEVVEDREGSPCLVLYRSVGE